MKAIEVINELESEEKINSYLFFNYMISNGFNPENYKNILELFQSPKGSISQYLKKYNQFLLSNLVSYKSLNEFGIKGGCGYLTSSNIVIPKTLKNDDIFLHNKTLSSNHKLSYILPTIDDFDVIIGNGITKNVKALTHSSKDKYIGYCGNKDNKETVKIMQFYKGLCNILKLYENKEYVFYHDTVDNKELCLVKTK